MPRLRSGRRRRPAVPLNGVRGRRRSGIAVAAHWPSARSQSSRDRAQALRGTGGGARSRRAAPRPEPSNIMLDGRGNVLITDFGLAGLAAQMHGAEVRNGTPAYMAPEQLAGKEVSIQSDIYARPGALRDFYRQARV